MRRYYIHYYNDFGNTYNLCWADEQHTGPIPDGYKRISRKEALRKASEERSRREHDQAFSGYADSAIYPIDYEQEAEVDFYRGVAFEPGNDPRIMEYTNREKYIAALKAYKDYESKLGL